MAAQKKLKAVMKPNAGSLIEIVYEGGGQVPEFLQGEYTSYAVANKRIEQYLRTEKRGAKSNGKAAS